MANQFIDLGFSKHQPSKRHNNGAASSAAAVKEQAGKLAAIVPFVIIKPSVERRLVLSSFHRDIGEISFSDIEREC